MVISDTSCMIDGLPLLYWRRNLGKSGQDSKLSNMLITIRLCKPGFTKSHMSLDNNYSEPWKQNCIRLWERSHDCTIMQLPNITAQLWHDVIPQQIEWQNQLITYDATKMYEINGQPSVRFPTLSSSICEYVKLLYLLNSYGNQLFRQCNLINMYCTNHLVYLDL